MYCSCFYINIKVCYAVTKNFISYLHQLKNVVKKLFIQWLSIILYCYADTLFHFEFYAYDLEQDWFLSRSMNIYFVMHYFFYFLLFINRIGTGNTVILQWIIRTVCVRYRIGCLFGNINAALEWFEISQRWRRRKKSPKFIAAGT